MYMNDIKINSVCAGGASFSLNDSPIEYCMSQKIEVIEYFTKFLINENFTHIIELGTYKGGFAILLDKIKNESNLNFKILTIDFAKWHLNGPATDDICSNLDDVIKECEKRNIEFILSDIFSDTCIDKIKSLLYNGKCLILCDGGDKSKEFNFFAKFLKPNDFIMAHDYDDYSSNNGWSWKEINYNMIKDSVELNNLVKYDIQNFNDVAWACFKKINI